MRFAGAGEVAEWTRHRLSAIWGDSDDEVIRGIARRMEAGDVIPAVALVDKREVVDGWHRVEAARIAGIGLHVEDLTEIDDLASRVLAGNMLRRRHSAVEATRLAILTLEASGRRLVAGRPEKDHENHELSHNYLKNDEIRELCGVSLDTVTRARRQIEAERDPGIMAARQRRLESKRLEREELEREELEARDATERDRARQSDELETLRSTVAAYELAEVPDFEETGESVHAVQEIIDPVVKRNEELLAERDALFAENDRLRRQVESLQAENDHLRRSLEIYEAHDKRQNEVL